MISLLKRATQFFALAAVISGQVYAQSVPDPANAGRLLEDRFLGAMPQPLSQRPLPKQERIVPGNQVTSSQGPRFRLHRLTFQGVSAYSDQELQGIFKTYLGREISVADLQTIAEQLTDRYRNDGYFLSTAFVPPQEITNGVAVIGVREGALGSVVFDGLSERDHSARLLRSIAETLMASSPLRQDVIERTLLILNDIQGIVATATFKPSVAEPGKIDLVIAVRQTRYEARAALNNRGSRFVGPWQGSLTGGYHGAISRFDTLTLQVLGGTDSQELLGFLATWHTPMNASGTTLTVELNRAWSEPGHTLRDFRLETVNQRLALGVLQPLIRERSRNLRLESALSARFNRTKVDGDLFSEDDYRAIELNLEYDVADMQNGVTLLNLGVGQGLDILGARESGSRLLTRSDGRSDFTKVTLYGSRSQFITPESSFFVAFSGQYAFSQLLSSEEFGYGGGVFGRAYDASELTGDHGASALLELRQNADVKGSKVLTSAQIFAAYDFGVAWNIDDEAKGPRETGASASVGVRYSLFSRLNGSFAMAKPLTRGVGAFAEDSSKSPRLFAGFQLEF